MIMGASLIFKNGNAEKVDDAIELLRNACCNEDISAIVGDVIQHIIRAEMKIFNLREILFFRCGGACQPDDEARMATEYAIQMCEDRLRAALIQIESASWCQSLSNKGKQHLINVDLAISCSSSYCEFIQKLNELEKNSCNGNQR